LAIQRIDALGVQLGSSEAARFARGHGHDQGPRHSIGGTMQLVSDYMNRRHKECDEAFARAEDMAAAADWIGLERDGGMFLREMERHIGLEEELLFPAFEEKTGMTRGPTEMMRMEHDQMRAMFAQMRAAIEAKDAGLYLGVADTLLILLQQHNMKEESMMYPMLDASLDEEAHSLLAQMESSAV
jgi:DUF438 domain-containing protein